MGEKKPAHDVIIERIDRLVKFTSSFEGPGGVSALSDANRLANYRSLNDYVNILAEIIIPRKEIQRVVSRLREIKDGNMTSVMCKILTEAMPEELLKKISARNF